MTTARAALIRVFAFVRKELAEVARQPRLVVTLILGPFVILALFGVGYRRTPPALATIFVAPAESRFASEVDEQIAAFGDQVDMRGITESLDDATDALRRGEVDLVVVVPPDPVGQVQAGEHAAFTVFHDQLDPFERATITLLTRSTVDDVNTRVLEQLIATGQRESADLQQLLPAASDAAVALRRALEDGDTAEARRQRRLLAANLSTIDDETGASEQLMAGIREQFDGDDADPGLLGRIDDLQMRIDTLDLEAAGEPLAGDIEEARRVEADLATLEETLAEFRRIDPGILVSPFVADSELVSAVDIDLTQFYAPGVIALLIQHLAVTLAALSLVRERALGTPEIFRVAPIGAGTILAGKLIAYVVAGAVVASSLSLLMLNVFSVPVAGSLVDYAAILALLTLASLGIGFVISAVVTTDIQAVNTSLILLLLSIFFSGFFLSLDRLTPAVRGVSWMLPITHAIDSLRDVMFRGIGIDARTWLALAGATVGLAVASTLSFRRRLELHG